MAHPTGCSFPWEGFRSHLESKHTNYLGSHWFTVNRRRWYTLWYTVSHLCQRCNSTGYRTTPGVILRLTQSHLCLQSLCGSIVQDCSVWLLECDTESMPLVVSTVLKSVTSRPIRGPTVVTQMCYSNGGSSNSIVRTKWDNFGKSGGFWFKKYDLPDRQRLLINEQR